MALLLYLWKRYIGKLSQKIIQWGNLSFSETVGDKQKWLRVI